MPRLGPLRPYPPAAASATPAGPQDFSTGGTSREEPQSALRDCVGQAAEAEGDVEPEVSEQCPTLLRPAREEGAGGAGGRHHGWKEAAGEAGPAWPPELLVASAGLLKLSKRTVRRPPSRAARSCIPINP